MTNFLNQGLWNEKYADPFTNVFQLDDYTNVRIHWIAYNIKNYNFKRILYSRQKSLSKRYSKPDQL